MLLLVYFRHSCTAETMSSKITSLFSFVIINILTSCRLRTSSTSARGFPLGTGMVPRMEQLEASSVCLTTRLNSSIFLISSMTNSLLHPSRICSIRTADNETQISARNMMWNTSSRKYSFNSPRVVSNLYNFLSFIDRDPWLLRSKSDQKHLI